MSVIPMQRLLRMMMAAGEMHALPVRVHWPVHDGVRWLAEAASGCHQHLLGQFHVDSDPDVGLAVRGVEAALDQLMASGFLALAGAGWTARWVPDADQCWEERRELLRLDPASATLVVQAGQRLATWASIALKNSDTAAVSWASTVSGPTPTERHPELVALR